jgi:hypothetical protein
MGSKRGVCLSNRAMVFVFINGLCVCVCVCVCVCLCVYIYIHTHTHSSFRTSRDYTEEKRASQDYTEERHLAQEYKETLNTMLHHDPNSSSLHHVPDSSTDLKAPASAQSATSLENGNDAGTKISPGLGTHTDTVANRFVPASHLKFISNVDKVCCMCI